MSAVLGVSAGYHDAAAALVVDGRIVAAMQQERFSRIKHDAALPLQAVAGCLKLGKLDARDLDAVVFYEDPYAKLERVLMASVRTFPRALRSFPRAMASQLGGKLWVLDELASRLGVERRKVRSQAHHASHAASAFFASPFSQAAVLTVDGVGEATTTALWRGDGRKLELLDSVEYPHSLGLLYSAVTAYLGFTVNEGEYKVMGLAAFGNPSLRDDFAALIQVQSDGAFTLGLPYFDFHTDTELGFGPRLEALLGPRRPLGKPWSLEDASDRRYADVAATLQHVLEDALLRLAARARELSGCDALCLAGGVALNAVANARLAPGGPLFVQPAAGDAGGALGAALLTSLELGDARIAPLTAADLGLHASAAEALALGRTLGLSVCRVDDPVSEAARRLVRGEVVAVVQGRFEWGPRALGHRSLLALPSPLDNRERINRIIKRREPFRPLAPAVLSSAASDWFGPHAPLLAPFMATVATVPEARREALSAVTHVDGSARLQTVRADGHFGELLAQVHAATGVPVLLNTSLNGKDEPIVASAAGALQFAMSHRIDAMLIEDVLVETKHP